MTDDGIIDLTEYLRRKEAEDEPPHSTFALYGADGERARFALPLWRSIYLASGDRGGIVWQREGEAEAKALVVLDLAVDPPRTRFPVHPVDEIGDDVAPLLTEDDSGHLQVYLGEEHDRCWYLVITGTVGREGPIPVGDREDILFLSGECAGLLFLRDFALEAETE